MLAAGQYHNFPTEHNKVLKTNSSQFATNLSLFFLVLIFQQQVALIGPPSSENEVACRKSNSQTRRRTRKWNNRDRQTFQNKSKFRTFYSIFFSFSSWIRKNLDEAPKLADFLFFYCRKFIKIPENNNNDNTFCCICAAGNIPPEQAVWKLQASDLVKNEHLLIV